MLSPCVRTSQVYIFCSRQSILKRNKNNWRLRIKANKGIWKAWEATSWWERVFTLLKQKKIFKNLANERMGEIQNLS